MERLDAFMARANAAYYANRDPFADFVTSPEITQVFGELLGLWAAVVWQSMGSPARVVLAEAGPGRGTLMADALRAIRQTMPPFAAAIDLHLIETSPRLREIQAGGLPGATWHEAIDTLPSGPLILIANEFLDALPIRQFVRRGEEWRERWVENGGFVEMESPGPPSSSPLARNVIGGEEIYETCEAARSIAGTLAARVLENNGAALLLDYGPEASGRGDSLQALRGGKSADPLQEPGEADLTAHVDFPAFADAARQRGAATHGPIAQGKFLARLGLFPRSHRLARAQPPRRAGELIEAAQRLAEPDRMGRLFKALAICHPDLPVPPGFDE